MRETVPAVSHDALLTLRTVALDGGFAGETKLSCSWLADEFEVSNQTASRRLRTLSDAGLIERDTVGDGQWVRITDRGKRALREEYETYRRVFEEPETVALEGSVTSGMGEGRHYISLPGYMEQFEDRLGYAPFAGTLNLDLTSASVRARAGLAAFEPITIEGWEGEDRTYGPAFCYPATLESGGADGDDTGEHYETAHVITPERTHHDEDQLEVIAPEKLREELDLTDGDRLTVHVAGKP
jgi:riboflavin kinase